MKRAVDGNPRLKITRVTNHSTISYPMEKQKTTTMGMLESSVAVPIHGRVQAVMGRRGENQYSQSYLADDHDPSCVYWYNNET